MTLSEFKYWLEGFEEAIDGSPTAKQWKKIKQRMDEVKEAQSVVVERHTHTHFRERYPYYQPIWLDSGRLSIGTITWQSETPDMSMGTSGTSLSFETPELALIEAGRMDALQC